MRSLTQLFAGVLTALWLTTGALAQAGSPALPHVEARGDGDQTLVLIHGIQGDWRVWESFMDRNAERYRMLAVRLPGMGGSEPLEFPEGNPLDRTPWADAVTSAIAKELESRGETDAVLVGHGLGGMIAMKLAAERPKLVGGVISVDATPAYPLNFQGFTFTPEERASTIAGNFLKNVDGMDPIAWRARWSEIAGRQAAAEADQRLLAELSEGIEFETWRRWIVEHSIPDLTVPLKESRVRLLAAAAINDGVRTVMGSEVMAEEFWRLPFDDWPEASVTFFDDSRHALFLDRPQAFDETLARFLERRPQPDWAYGEPGDGPTQPDSPETEDERP